jgi:hypothetical protein
MNSKPRPALQGGVSAVAHTLTANDATTLTLSVAEQALDVNHSPPCWSKVRFTGKWRPDATTVGVGACRGTSAAVEVALCGAALGCEQDARPAMAANTAPTAIASFMQ